MTVKCKQCNKKFNSEHSLEQHTLSKHIPALPFCGARGNWVLSKNFDGNKSFGSFSCFRCKKDWTSAHSFPGFKQGCKRCNREYYPRFLWENNDYSDDSSDSDSNDYVESNGHHDSSRCQACRYGICRG